VLIQAVVSGGGVAWLLATRPMILVGDRSYALYLWHWPIFDLTRPGIDVAWPSPVVFLVRFGGSVLLADLSFRFVEQPVRSGGLGRLVGRSRVAWRQRSLALPLSVGTTAVAGLTAAALLAAAVNVSADRNPVGKDGLVVDGGHGASLAAAASSAGPGARQSSDGLPPPPAKPLRVTIVGDSQALTLVLNAPPDLAKYIQLSEGATLGCGFQLARFTSRSGARIDAGHDCAYAVGRWVSSVAQFHPDEVILVSGAMDVYDEQLDGVDLKFGSPEWDKYYLSRLASTVHQLQGTGVRRVDLALAPCWRPNSQMYEGYAAERGEGWRVQHVDALLALFGAQAGPGVGTLKPPPEFCGDPKIAADTSLRFDGLHYTQAGALMYVRAVIPQIFAEKH
jgi:hypothetical protein